MRDVILNTDSYLEIKKQQQVKVRNEYGEIIPAIKVTKHLAESEVNLGSFKKPNKEIVHFEYKEKRKPEDNILGRFFGS